MQNLSWYAKYQPKIVEDYIFETEQLKTQVYSWVEQGYIPGNLLLHGKAGLGKSALADILIRATIKSGHDLKKMRTRSVAEVDELFSWLQKAPVKSKRKIVLFEEMDRISPQSATQLKSDVMEKFQEMASFIGTTNYISRLDPALVSRFNFKIELNGTNTDGVFDRLKYILKEEKVSYDEAKLKDFVIAKHKIGMRNLITALQSNVNNNGIALDEIQAGSGSSEDKICELTMTILRAIFECKDSYHKKMAIIQPCNSDIICKPYAELSELLQFSQNIDYVSIFEMIVEQLKFVPIQILAANYAEKIDTRKMQNLTYLSFVYDSSKSIVDLA